MAWKDEYTYVDGEGNEWQQSHSRREHETMAWTRKDEYTYVDGEGNEWQQTRRLSSSTKREPSVSVSAKPAKAMPPQKSARVDDGLGTADTGAGGGSHSWASTTEGGLAIGMAPPAGPPPQTLPAAMPLPRLPPPSPFPPMPQDAPAAMQPLASNKGKGLNFKGKNLPGYDHYDLNIKLRQIRAICESSKATTAAHESQLNGLMGLLDQTIQTETAGDVKQIVASQAQLTNNLSSVLKAFHEQKDATDKMMEAFHVQKDANDKMMANHETMLSKAAQLISQALQQLATPAPLGAPPSTPAGPPPSNSGAG